MPRAQVSRSFVLRCLPLLLSGLACSSPEGTTTGSGGTVSTTGGAATGGTVSATGGVTTGGVATGGLVGAGGASTGGVNTTGGVSTGGANPTGGASTGGASTGGVNTTGGSAGAVATGGASAGSAGVAGSGGSAGSTGGSGGAAANCPANATFCSSFEDAGLPEKASYQPAYQAQDWMMFLGLDSTTANSGAHSLLVKTTGNSGYSVRMLSVPIPGPAFWVRLFVRSDVDFGQAEHNAFFEAMVGDGDPNKDSMEVAEQYCQVVLNHSDVVVTSNDSPMTCGGAGALLPKNQWHCMEAFFDGPNGVVQVYANKTKIIDKTGWPALSYGAFNFGYEGFHGPARNIWYDDVAVGAVRIGCP